MPWYFNYFIHSVKYNPSIDFILISDVKKFKALPKNVRHVYKSIHNINELATQKFGFTTKIENGYKFSDFKPAYGFLFAEIVKGYDFWGQTDIDVIYGDLRNFLNEEVLNEFDYISVRHDFPTGCFSLFRNNRLVNNIFKRSKDFKDVFSDSKHFCFDECNNVHDLLTAGKSIFEIETEIESFMHLIKSAEARKELKAHFDFICIEGVTGRIKFDNGKLFYKNKYEVILYHLIALKRKYTPRSIPSNIPGTYNISSRQIYFNVRR
jgi:hypothetical protein